MVSLGKTVILKSEMNSYAEYTVRLKIFFNSMLSVDWWDVILSQDMHYKYCELIHLLDLESVTILALDVICLQMCNCLQTLFTDITNLLALNFDT